jgi:hypothetical protein
MLVKGAVRRIKRKQGSVGQCGEGVRKSGMTELSSKLVEVGKQNCLKKLGGSFGKLEVKAGVERKHDSVECGAVWSSVEKV